MNRTAIKICGIRDVETALSAVAAGASYIGLVFCDSSKRNIDIKTASRIAAEVKAAGEETVAVLVNQSFDEINEICGNTGITHLQFHGSTALKSISEMDSEITRIIAIKINPDGSFKYPEKETMHSLRRDKDFILYDSVEPGSGVSFNLQNFTPIPGFRFFMAGGMNTSNVSGVIKRVKPYGIDVSSSVESLPGVKDVAKIKHFINHIKNT